MFPNLRAEMAREKITNERMAKTIGLNPATLSVKLNTPDRLKLSETKAIRANFFPKLSTDYLFETISPNSQDT